MITLSRVRFGPSGYPDEAKGNVKRVFEILEESGLDALEYAAVYGLRTSEKAAKVIGDLSRESRIFMSLHAAYFISLASKKEETRERSKERLIKALRFAPLMNVKRIVFHPGTRGGLSDDETFRVIRKALEDVWDVAGDAAGGAHLSPEVAGKVNAFGSVEEIINLCSGHEGIIPTIDWAHIYARRQGAIKSYDDYLKIINQFEDALGKKFTDNMHFHVSGIVYTKAGESSHKPLGESWGPDIAPLMDIILEQGYSPVIISETPVPIRGALYAKALLDELTRTKS